MKIFSKFVFICNLCFIASVILRFVENAKKKSGHFDGQILLKPLESMLVVLGYGSVIISFIFLLACVYWLIAKKIKQIPRWLVITNLVFFVIQFYYFFFSNF
ncbi:hypothetical protein [Ferruginibacter sp.]|nr:hypothetical protein [Ferruginibacter sp.]